MTPDTERHERVTSPGQTTSGQAELSQSPDQSAEIEAERAASGGESASPAESAQPARSEQVEPVADEDSALAQAGSPAAAPAEPPSPSAYSAPSGDDSRTFEANDRIDLSTDGELALTLQKPGSDEDSGSSTTVTAHYTLAGEAALQSSGAAAAPAVETLAATAQPAGSGMQDQLKALRDRMDDALGREPVGGNDGATVWSGSTGLDALRDKASDLLSGWRDDEDEPGDASASSPLEALRDDASDLLSGWRDEECDAGDGPGGLSSALSDSQILARFTDGDAETQDAGSGGLLARIFDGDLASVSDRFDAGGDAGLFDDLNLSPDWPVNDADGGHQGGWDLFDSAG